VSLAAPRSLGSIFGVARIGEDASGHLFELRTDAWIERDPDAARGSPQTATAGYEGALWITTTQALMSTREAAAAMAWLPTGCDGVPLRDAKPYRYRNKRPPTYDCPAGVFVHVVGGIEPWAGLYDELKPQIEQGFRKARATRPVRAAAPIERQPAIPVTPVVAPELDELYFGFHLRDGHDEELQLLEIERLAAELGPPASIRLVCADPSSLQEPALRAMANEHR
jgi:hypothetical protein